MEEKNRIEYDDLVDEIADIHATLEMMEKKLHLVGPSSIGPGVPVAERRTDSTALCEDHIWVSVWKSLGVITEVCRNMNRKVLEITNPGSEPGGIKLARLDAWQNACEWEGIESDSPFVVFSETNPHVQGLAQQGGASPNCRKNPEEELEIDPTHTERSVRMSEIDPHEGDRGEAFMERSNRS